MSPCNQHPRCSSRPGFSLVEVALAMMVMAVGLMAIFAIFPKALDLNREAQDNAYAALFAEDVINGIRGQLHVVDWDDILSNQLAFEVVATDMWSSAPAPGELKMTNRTIGQETGRVTFVPENFPQADQITLVYHIRAFSGSGFGLPLSEALLKVSVWPDRGLVAGGKSRLVDEEKYEVWTKLTNPRAERYQ